MARGVKIDCNIINYLAKKSEEASTREIALALKLAWHSVNTHCLKLQIKGNLTGIKMGNMNLWRLVKKD